MVQVAMQSSYLILIIYIFDFSLGFNISDEIPKRYNISQKTIDSKKHIQISDPIMKSVKPSHAVATKGLQYFDKEWQYKPNQTISKIPDLILNLYNSIENNKSKDFVYNSSTVKCFRISEYNILDTGAIFRFNLTGIQDYEQIIRLEFNIYKSRPPSHDFSKSTLIRLYKLYSNKEEDSTDLQELLGASYVFPHFNGWQVFNLERLTEKWKPTNFSVDLFISFTDVWNQVLNPKTLDYDISNSYLFMYLYDNTTSKMKPFSIQAPLKESLLQDTQTCRIESCFVNFQNGNFENFIVYPNGLMINKCTGLCRLDACNITNHAKLSEIVQDKSEDKLSSCVPDEYASAIIIFLDPFNNIVLKNYNNLIVKHCSCR